MTPALPTTDQLPAAVREGLERLAADAVGKFGPTPLSKLVAGHLHLFADLRELGASWAQSAGLLAAHGIMGTDGPFAADVLRATYARAAASAAASDATKRNRTKRNNTNGNETQRDAVQRSEAKRSAIKRDGAEPNEKNPEKTGGDAPKRKVANANAAPAAQDSEPDRSTAAADGLARRAVLIHKPLHTR